MTRVIFKHVRVRNHKELREQKIDELSVSRLDSIASTYDSLLTEKWLFLRMSTSEFASISTATMIKMH